MPSAITIPAKSVTAYTIEELEELNSSAYNQAWTNWRERQSDIFDPGNVYSDDSCYVELVNESEETALEYSGELASISQNRETVYFPCCITLTRKFILKALKAIVEYARRDPLKDRTRHKDIVTRVRCKEVYAMIRRCEQKKLPLTDLIDFIVEDCQIYWDEDGFQFWDNDIDPDDEERWGVLGGGQDNLQILLQYAADEEFKTVTGIIAEQREKDCDYHYSEELFKLDCGDFEWIFDEYGTRIDPESY